MTSALDMSLDDIIKSNKKSSGPSSRGRGGPRSNTGPGPSRRFPHRAANRSAPYSIASFEAPDSTWKHDMFTDSAAGYVGKAARASAIETGTKLLISNLEYGVSNEDIKELFAEVGDIKRCGVHYDRSGRSEGTAEVVFARRADAVAAVKRYNNVQLDGKPMKVEIVGTNIATPAVMPPASNVLYGKQTGGFRSGQGGAGAFGRPRGGGRGARRVRGRGRGRSEKISAEDLDADLEKYHSETMQTD
ncbi:RRM_1 domain-containing protein/FoP_duplication domain-containing protein [Cephalotus follicularis]|uniref:RRM_1 domain-containing protein/FoP_duplication domain-containing protein n=1 Tax=Cephalotus follicularis TaxID=3775 RepID=A0A1Q3B4K6_CEPFO|nr:RRM_1 domain-containing protein/FoP_duplication domain-containing protein [Cephalotus follicularis]